MALRWQLARQGSETQPGRLALAMVSLSLTGLRYLARYWPRRRAALRQREAEVMAGEPGRSF